MERGLHNVFGETDMSFLCEVWMAGSSWRRVDAI